MLVLTRTPGETIVLLHAGVRIVVSYEERRGNNMRIGIDAPKAVKIIRGELEERNDDERVSEEAD